LVAPVNVMALARHAVAREAAGDLAAIDDGQVRADDAGAAGTVSAAPTTAWSADAAIAAGDAA
jgi:hypothetical protein